MVLLKVTGEGEIFYIQQRVGFGGREFGLIKFATMLKNSPHIGTGTITTKGDPRVLPVGKLLRKSKLNELPQLINILKGDMSVVGPRPLTPNMFDMYPSQYAVAVVSVRPGLSGIGSIIFRDEEALIGDREDPMNYYKTEISPYKGALEEWFAANRGVWTYFKCIAATFWVVLLPAWPISDRFFYGLPQPKGALAEDLKALRYK
jgi:lipopolysaccharide/colanic/teichoic acid biosynthesis glycosyltransferase